MTRENDGLVGDYHRYAGLDALVHVNHVVVQLPDAAQVHGAPQLHPVGQGCPMDRVFAGADLRVGLVARAHRIAWAGRNQLAFFCDAWAAGPFW